MSLLRSFKIEILKLKHTSYWMFQIGTTLICLFFFISYYRMYNTQSEDRRIYMIFEIIATLLPVICSISVAYLVKQEEQIANLYGMLSVRRRGKMISEKLLFTWLMGSISLLIITFGIGVISSLQRRMIYNLVGLYVGMVAFSLFFYIFHLFLNLRYGIGMSLFWGVFESMQAVIYSNIKLSGFFKFIPFSWPMEWKQDLWEGILIENRTFWSICILIQIVCLVFFVRWFTCWEGRKNYGT